MIGEMGNCFPWKNKRKNLSLLILGLDNAGKTTAVKGVQGETLDVAPTVGYSEATTKFGNYDLRIMDVGGGRSIRGVWKHYMAEAHGVIFVVDASDEERMEEGREELALVLQHPFIAGKPILLLANKQDVDGAMNEASVCDALQLEEVVNRNRCPCKVELCAAVTSKPKKMDPPLQRGLLWLVTNIAGQFDPLTARMKSDMEMQEEERKEEAMKRKERIRLKHEREKREEKERNKKEGKVDGDSVENRQVDAEKQNDESSNTQIKSPFHENESTIAVSARSVRSGLGDVIMDDDDISIPGCISPNHDKAILEDSCTESQKLGGSSSGKDTPTENLEMNLASFSVTDNGEDNSDLKIKKKKKKAKRNKINPLDMEPSAGVLAPLKPLGKLAPLNGKLSGDNPSFDLQPLPPLKPNADSEEDLVV